MRSIGSGTGGGAGTDMSGAAMGGAPAGDAGGGAVGAGGWISTGGGATTGGARVGGSGVIGAGRVGASGGGNGTGAGAANGGGAGARSTGGEAGPGRSERRLNHITATAATRNSAARIGARIGPGTRRPDLGARKRVAGSSGPGLIAPKRIWMGDRSGMLASLLASHTARRGNSDMRQGANLSERPGFPQGQVFRQACQMGLRVGSSPRRTRLPHQGMEPTPNGVSPSCFGIRRRRGSRTMSPRCPDENRPSRDRPQGCIPQRPCSCA